MSAEFPDPKGCLVCGGDPTSDMDDEVNQPCSVSQRPCGHHCNHWTDGDECCWCGAPASDEEDEALLNWAAPAEMMPPGPWVEVCGSTPSGRGFVLVTQSLSGVRVEATLDIGVGLAGQEVVKVSQWKLHAWADLVPIAVPKGSRLSVRVYGTPEKQIKVTYYANTTQPWSVMDQELPGLWERADFEGGQDETRP